MAKKDPTDPLDEKRVKRASAHLELRKELLEIATQEYDQHKKTAESLEDLEKNTLAFIEAERSYINAQREAGVASAAQIKRLQELDKAHKTHTQVLSRAKKAQADYDAEVQRGEQILRSYGNAVIGIGGPFETFYKDYIPKSAGELKGLTNQLTNAFKGTDTLGTAMQTASTGFGIFNKILLKVVGNTFNFGVSLDKAVASFKQATGAGNEYNSVIGSVAAEYAVYGISAEDAGAATGALFSQFRDFTNLSETQAKSVLKTVTALEKLGLGAETSAQILNTATKALYMNTTESTQLLREMEAVAAATGKPISEIGADFAAASPKLAFYGKEMLGVFRELEMQSKSTGLSMDQLLGLVGEKFDTFEGAGQAVGRLNAILGGPYLNSIDMLNASEADRLEMIQKSLDASGLVFDDLNKFEQKTFASAIGTDVDTLRKSLNSLDPAVEAQALKEEELAKKAADARDIMTKLSDALNGLVVNVEPLVSWMSKLINKFSGWMKVASDWLNKDSANMSLGMKVFGLAMLAVVFQMGKMALNMMTIVRQGPALISNVNQMTAAMTRLAAANTAANATSPGGAGKFYKGGQFMPGGMRAPAGGMMAGGGAAPGGAPGPGGAPRGGWAGKGFKPTGAGMAAGMGGEHLKKKGHVGAGKAVSTLGMAATGAGMGMMFGPWGAAIGGLAGLGYGAWKNYKAEDGGEVSDALITRSSGGKAKFTKISSKDDVLVGKPQGPLDKLAQGVERGTEGLAATNPMVWMMRGAMKAVVTPILKEAITDPIVMALGAGTGTGGATGGPEIKVIVKIGEKELAKEIIKAIESPQVAQAMGPYSMR